MKKSAALFVVLTGLVWLVVSSGCAGGGGDIFGNNGSGGNIGSTTGTVSDNPKTILPWSQIEGQTNVAATMRVNDSGTTVTQLPAIIYTAQIQSVNLSGRIEPAVQDLSSQPGNNRGVFEGDSGSPVLVGGNVVGGLFGSSDNVTFDARGIQQEMATASGPAKTRTPLQRKSPTWFYEGPAKLLPYIRSKPGFENTRYNGPRNTSPDSRLLGGSAVPPLPGRRFASPFVIGPYVEGYDAATYTIQLQDGHWVGTSHGLEDAGSVSWPVMSFYVDGFANGAVKGHIIGPVYGTLLYDGENGSLINASTPATMMPMITSTKFNGVPLPAVTHNVRFDKGSDAEDQGIEVAAQSTIDAQLQGKGPTFNATGSVSLTVGGVTTAHAFNFPANMTLDSFESSLGTQLNTILKAQQAAAPNSQITKVVVSLTVTG